MMHSQSSLVRQPKNRPKPRHEHRSDAAAKRLRSSIQNMGVAQVVSGKENNFDIQMNGKAGGNIHCGFCTKNHQVTFCPTREELKMTSFEYCLSTTTPNEEKALQDRLMAMPLSRGDGKGNVLNTVAARFQGLNFIIKEACNVAGTTPGQIDSMNFCVTFLAKNAESEPDGESQWISGTAMNTLVTHKNKKKKYVYDETIHLKEGWVSRIASM